VSELPFQKFYDALQHFAKLQREKSMLLENEYQPLQIPNKLVISSDIEGEWPEHLWGFPLGAKCVAVRNKLLYVKNNPKRQKALEELGFQWCGNATLGWLKVIHASAIYSKVHGRNLDVPTKFVVPSPPKTVQANSTKHNCNDLPWPWPEKLWGFPLGQRLRDIRLKGRYLSGESAKTRRAQLDALGFNWKPKRGRRRRSLGDDQSS